MYHCTLKIFCKLFGFSLSQIDYPEIVDHINPRYRFMAAYEQRVEPPDRRWQYLLFAAEPYETIAFKVTVMVVMLMLMTVAT